MLWCEKNVQNFFLRSSEIICIVFPRIEQISMKRKKKDEMIFFSYIEVGDGLYPFAHIFPVKLDLRDESFRRK